jgi:hypothetical protein
MIPISYNHTIDQGTSYSYEMIISDQSGTVVDLTNAQIRSVIKKDYTSDDIVSFTISKTEPMVGRIVLSLSATDTASLKAGSYVYDVMYSLNTIVNKVVNGVITVKPSTSSF